MAAAAVAAVAAAVVVEDVVEVKEDAVVEVMEVEEHEGVAMGEEATAEEAEAEAAEDDLAYPSTTRNGSEFSGASEMVVEKADPQQGLSTQHPQQNSWGGAVTTPSMTPGSTPLVRRVGNLTGRPWCWTIAGYDSM